MSSSHATPFAALKRLAGPPPDARSDEELLRKFCTDRDEAAFAVIVRRHGGLVLDVCRAVLRTEADAEDSFQATFVSLAANASRVRCPAALAGWLHSVAWRTAIKARRGRDRRRTHESRVPARPDLPAPDPSWAEVRQAIHEEVNRLPDRYRAAIVLFYLTGRTQDEVGRNLGLSTAGAKKRLERGRTLLRTALDSRGFGPTVVLAAAALLLPIPAAALTTHAAELAVRFIVNRTAVPTAILALLPNGVRLMSTKIVFATAVLFGVATTVGVGVLQGGFADQPGRSDPNLVAAKPMPLEGAGDAEQPRADGSDEPAKKTPPPPRPATEWDRFRAMDPTERLKLVEKLAGANDPFTAAKRGEFKTTISERGSIEPANYADLICKVKAREKGSSVATTIRRVVEEGRLVKKGDLLISLDDAAIREQLQVATVKLREAEAAMILASENAKLVQQETAVGVRLAEIDVRLVEIELKDAPNGKAKEVLELKVEQAKLKLDRVLSRGKAQQLQAETDKRAKRAALELEAQRHSNLENELKQCELTAPADGLVTYPAPTSGRFPGTATIAEGESVREGQKLLRIADLKQLVIATRIHEAEISTVRVGQISEVRVDAHPGKLLSGKVSQVSPVASTSNWQSGDVKVYPVTIAIEDVPFGLKPGMSGEVQIADVVRRAVLHVPLKSIVTVGKERMCFIKSGKELLERKVITGKSNVNSVEIKEGLKEGDLVVTDPPAFLGRP